MQKAFFLKKVFDFQLHEVMYLFVEKYINI